MQLNLKNPIIFFDLETTGLNIVNDRIIEISYIKVLPDGTETDKTYRVNPECHISENASEITGVYDKDVADCPTFKQLAQNIANDFKGCDLAGYNSNNFDIPLLAEEFIRAEVDIDLKKHKFIDVQVLFYKMEPRTLKAAYQFYCEKNLDNAHSANADTMATYEVLKAQLDRYASIENNVDFLSKFTANNRNVDYAGRIIYNDKDEEIFNFGKYKGQKVIDVLTKDTGYYGWIMQSDFPLYTKKVLTQIRLKSQM